MKRRSSYFAIMLVLGLSGSVLPFGRTVFASAELKDEIPAVTEAEFVRLHAALQPKADELWRTIPWNISLLDAQRVAAETKRPLFIWAMDGHPLGCT